ncbi:MAG: TetR/AcrR family transcriptional regulator [Clostridia bacterium]|nr:TetR/AcrR family transcriptional regulator [Clostridia bacterium]
MASAFSPTEREAIDKLLVQAARQCAATIGIRKTTLEQLTQQAGISKSAFYKFYESKEHLFFRIMEEWHAKVYSAAEEALKTSAALPMKERVAKALLSAFDAMEQGGMNAAFSQELPYLLRRLPPEILDESYRTDEEHIAALIDLCGVDFTVPRETVQAMLMILVTSLPGHQRIGPLYRPALELLVHSLCEQIIR